MEKINGVNAYEQFLYWARELAEQEFGGNISLLNRKINRFDSWGVGLNEC